MRVTRGRVVAVCIGDEPGPKRRVERIELCSGGVLGDCHFGSEREVSILPNEALEKAAKRTGRVLSPGTFAENILTEGIDWFRTWNGSLVRIGGALLETRQRGKEHCGLCSVAEKVGFCIGDRELVFCDVLRGGCVEGGMEVEVLRADVWSERKVVGRMGEAARFLRRKLRKTNTILLLDPRTETFVVRGGSEAVLRLIEGILRGDFRLLCWEEMEPEEKVGILQSGLCVYRRGV